MKIVVILPKKLPDTEGELEMAIESAIGRLLALMGLYDVEIAVEWERP